MRSYPPQYSRCSNPLNPAPPIFFFWESSFCWKLIVGIFFPFPPPPEILFDFSFLFFFPPPASFCLCGFVCFLLFWFCIFGFFVCIFVCMCVYLATLFPYSNNSKIRVCRPMIKLSTKYQICFWQENKLSKIFVKYIRFHVYECIEQIFASNLLHRDRKPKCWSEF